MAKQKPKDDLSCLIKQLFPNYQMDMYAYMTCYCHLSSEAPLHWEQHNHTKMGQVDNTHHLRWYPSKPCFFIITIRTSDWLKTD